MSFIKLSCADFISILNPIARLACSNKKGAGVLGFARILITNKAGKQAAYASASNGGQSMARRIESFESDIDMLSEDKEVLLCGEKLLSIVNAYTSFEGSDTVKISWDSYSENGGVITAKRSKMKIDTADPSTYPAPPKLQAEHSVLTIPLNQLQDVTLKGRSSVAVNNSARPALNGVNLKLNSEAKNINVTATDGYRVYDNTLAVTNAKNDFNIVIPTKLIDMIQGLKATNDNDLVRLRADSNSLEVTFKSTLIRSQLLDNKFPDLSELFQNEPQWLMDLDQKDIADALGRLSAATDKRLPAIEMMIDDETQETHLRTVQGGKTLGEDYLKSKVTLKPENALSVNLNFLMQAVANVTSKIARIGQHPKDKYLVIQGENETSRMIVLPLRT
ncbi:MULTISPECIES: DNA polymerase III subunit beta [unclassified Pseudoalteromonas]|uniref:DNA polymerase III subunit beta n=1 Tax=unclassified Pseudoalteromonas TaxID=194690 RepID=UPI0023589126|nr:MULTISPECIES: DNA polymerase III subunit beta [unclassified Pseudoalteromonas]MDC9563436.1 DNA polymerase III subunit beta [Pseudoalteromonas sp. GAB2316C]MDC9572082.1 DNA polymerase III subunit beta [Pseudoalteromonas sp. GABNS16A]MDC9583883.1 DNA polymerase III subunit beta [Pseudoalteromonas sp. GABNS16C]MDC9607848.1 DNA polymerase III subunit beta [Pseudoalteromonas sp. GABNS16H]